MLEKLINLGMLVFMCIPLFVAYKKKSDRKLIIFILVFLGIVFYTSGYFLILFQLGNAFASFYIFSYALWVAGLIVALLPKKKKGVPFISPDKIAHTAIINVADELDKLFALKQKGAITEAEYETRKQQLLKS